MKSRPSMTSNGFQPGAPPPPPPLPLAPWRRFVRATDRLLESPWLEPVRWVLAAGAGALLASPFLTDHVVGTGDARWYGQMVGDFVTQWRAGVFPVFVGQSEYAFNGAVSPVRFAPYLQHAAGLLDLLTGRTLPPTALLNGVLFLSYMGAAVVTYATLAAMAKRGRWLALALACLAVSCPAILALGYTGDLFMSVCALPYVPLALYALWRIYHHSDRAGFILLGATLAMLWLCHAPIAFWMTGLTALSLLLQSAAWVRRRREWKNWLLGAATFAALAAYVFVSVATLGLPSIAAEQRFVLQAVREAFPAVLGPVSEGANSLADFQLGWSLWLVLLVALGGAVLRPDAFRRGLAAGAVLFLVLLLPLPWLTEHLWDALPQVVVNITNHWPMQRLWPLLSFVAVTAAHPVLNGICGTVRWRHATVLLLLGLGLNWSWLQAGFFLERATTMAAGPTAGPAGQLPENRVLTRYAFTPFPQMPPYFSHGHIEPLWENRLLNRATLAEIDSNRRSVLDAGRTTVRAEGILTARPDDTRHTSYTLLDGLAVEPGHHYALEIRAGRPDYSGSLIVRGSTFSRDYPLPDSAVNLTLPMPPAGFGITPTSLPAISLFTQVAGSPPLSLGFVASPPLTEDPAGFGRYVLREYDPAQLPIVISQWSPYRAVVTAAGPAFLETPRLFLEGYAATVNGQPTPVRRSAGGLVMIPVEAGNNRVELSYPGPAALRAGYAVTFGGWLAFAGWMAWSACRRRPACS